MLQAHPNKTAAFHIRPPPLCFVLDSSVEVSHSDTVGLSWPQTDALGERGFVSFPPFFKLFKPPGFRLITAPQTER